MRTVLYKYTLLILTLANFNSLMIKAQEAQTKSKVALQEKVNLITDRDVYCVNELIQFKAINNSPMLMKNGNWSNVLYIEIVTADGIALVQKKFNYSAQGTEGAIKIPQGILSGNYYLRAYTRWMRNYTAESFFYKKITILNPFESEVEQNPGHLPLSEIHFQNSDVFDLNIKTNKNNFKQREKVEVQIHPNDKLDICVISVVRKGLVSPEIIEIKTPENRQTPLNFIPETRTLSVSGKVVNMIDSVPLPFCRVYLTIIKEQPEIRNVLSNQEGNFYFSLPNLHGNYELLISVEKEKTDMNALILIDNDFSSRHLNLPFIPFEITNENNSLLEELSFNSQIQHLYGNTQESRLEDKLNEKSKFYGEPVQVVNLSEYIDLASLEDYFRELVSLVSVRKEQGEKRFKVLGEHPELKNNPPLVLLDMVAVTNNEVLLKLPPENLSLIEVINQPFVYGSLIYGGIISITSKEGNLAGMKLSENSRYINYQMLNDGVLDQSEEKFEKRIPDFRNTLYWNSHFLSDEESFSFSFFTSDVTGEFSIVVSGIDDTNIIKSSVYNFMVTE